MLLAIDTSTPQIGLALYDGAQVLAESLWLSKARHTVEIAPSVMDLFSHTGTSIEQVKALGVAIGPGSFTALRVGLSFIKGLAFARNIPVYGINTLDVVAASQPASGLPLYCVLPAGRKRIAVSKYQSESASPNPANPWSAAGPAAVMTADALSAAINTDSLLCGDLSATERALLALNPHIRLASPARSTRRPGLLAELAYTRWQHGPADDADSLAPIYLHIADPIPEPDAAVRNL